MTDADRLGLGLDDIIRMDRTSNRRGGGAGKRGLRGRAGGRGGGGQTNGFRARGGGGLPRTFNAPATGRWKHDLFENNSNRGRTGQRTSGGVNSTTKLLVSNLDYGVTSSDIQELFEDIGAVRIARVHFDEAGRSLGTAEIIYERRADAVAAQQKYNGLNLDGRPMDIRIVGGIDDGSQQQSNRMNGTANKIQQNGNRTRGAKQQQQQQQQQQQNGFNGIAKKGNLTAEDLDADLEAYRATSASKK